tara:strand:+ start:383 stop:727 length:345 start_codon:yes stop_codon:yes gene_type:complete
MIYRIILSPYKANPYTMPYSSIPQKSGVTMDYDEMKDHIVKLKVGALYELGTWGSDRRWLTLYLGYRTVRADVTGDAVLPAHMFYDIKDGTNNAISNSRMIRMANMNLISIAER